MEIRITIVPTFDKIGTMLGNIDMTTFLREEVNKIAALVERYSKQVTPVGTPESTGKKGYVGGRLRASINFTPATIGLRAEVGPHTDYATFVHEGTRYMRGRPFMAMGTEIASQEYNEKDIGDRIEKEFADKFKKL